MVRLAAAELTLEVEPRWEEAELTVPGGEWRNASDQTLRVTRLALLVSGVVLHRADGGSVRLEGQYGLVDIEKGRTAVALRGVPSGEYVGLEFRVGLPPEINHGDVGRWAAGHPLNPLVNGLHWSWQGGYVFFALEGRWGERAEGEGRGAEEGEGGRGFLYHVAAGAGPRSAGFQAQFTVRAATRVRLALDVARVLGDLRLSADDGSESTHSGEGDPVAEQIAAGVERAWFWLGVEEARGERSEREAAERRSGDAGYGFVVPAGFPQPELPADNPLTEAGVALGRSLFFDTRLSGNGRQACADCHAPERAFSDGVALSVGAEGAVGTRNAMPLFNLAWAPAQGWDGARARVREQAIAAMTNPVEMNADAAQVAERLNEDAELRRRFAAVLGDKVVTVAGVGLALEQYLLSIVHADSRFDRVWRGEAELTEEEKRGFELFVTEYDPVRGRRGADCFHCHGGALLTDFGLKNNGLEVGRANDRGRENVTSRAEDRAKFKTPSLRNVAVTAPYMHDGRFATLEEVVAHYDHGVARSATLDANLAKHPVGGLGLSAEEQRALVAFLRTLTEVELERRADKGGAAQ